MEHGYLWTEDNLAGNPTLGKDSNELGPLASYMVHVKCGGADTQNKSSQLSELLKAMLKGNGRSAKRLEYHMLQLMLLTITPVLDD